MGCSSWFQRKNKPAATHDYPPEEQDSSLNNFDPVPFSSVYSVDELVPERYLVLLTDQMTEMLFRLMTCNEISENGSDYRTVQEKDIDSSTVSTPNVQSPLALQSVHKSCVKCNMKMLTIEEFHELHSAFRRVDHDRDNFLTRDEIRTTLSYLFELTEYDIKEIISVFDMNKDDRVSFEEYINEMKHRLLHEFTRDEIKLAFEQADGQQNGYLRVDELKNAIGYLNLHLPSRRIIEIANECMKNELVNSVDFALFTTIVESLHRREPITLQKFKRIHHTVHPITTT
ncbi:unnamed protein product [Adineta ricciae]|uniref:EF-hand domain-containing protein n=1 Tax=Adineta ricciae TaxID=249248 RepID=A0A813U8B7_ADIRI|nr:unnamed protein product [Adineta ricciae]